MNIIPNLTLVALQFLPFIVTIAALYFIAFKPMMDYLEGRENASSGATGTAKELEAEIQTKKSEILSEINTALKAASDKRAVVRQELVEEYNEFVYQKRLVAEGVIKEAINEIAIEKSAARQEVRVQAENFANEIAGKIIGRNIA